MFIINEDTGLRTVPKKLKNLKEGRLRMRVGLQTAGDINRNKRLYTKGLLEGGVNTIMPRVSSGDFLGELDHPIDKNPVRQVTVLYSKASHQFKEIGWDGNTLVAIIETLRTKPHGENLKVLAEDGIPIGFSFRGMGDLKQTTSGGRQIFEVRPPLHVVTWDAVSYPSHQGARLIEITENVTRMIHESANIYENNGLVCTSEGYCYFPNEFDQLVERRIIKLKNKYEL